MKPLLKLGHTRLVWGSGSVALQGEGGKKEGPDTPSPPVMHLCMAVRVQAHFLLKVSVGYLI